MPQEAPNKELAGLIELRLNKNLRRLDIATKIGCDVYEVRNIENGDVTHPLYTSYKDAVHNEPSRTGLRGSGARLSRKMEARIKELRGEKTMPGPVIITKKQSSPLQNTLPESISDVIRAFDSFLVDTTTSLPTFIATIGVDAAWIFNARRGTLKEDEIVRSFCKHKGIIDWAKSAASASNRSISVRSGAARILMGSATPGLDLQVTVQSAGPIIPPTPASITVAAPEEVEETDDEFENAQVIAAAVKRYMEVTRVQPTHMCDRLKIKSDQLTRMLSGNLPVKESLTQFECDRAIRDFIARFVAGRGLEELASKLGLATDAAQRIAEKIEVKQKVQEAKEAKNEAKAEAKSEEKPVTTTTVPEPEKFSATKFTRTEIANGLQSFLTFNPTLKQNDLAHQLYTSESNISLLLTGNLMATVAVTMVAKAREDLFKFMRGFMETAVEDLAHSEAVLVRGTCAEIFAREPKIQAHVVEPVAVVAPAVAAAPVVIPVPAPAPAPVPASAPKKKPAMQFIDGDLTVRELMEQVSKGDATLQIVKYTAPDGSAIFGIQVA